MTAGPLRSSQRNSARRLTTAVATPLRLSHLDAKIAPAHVEPRHFQPLQEPVFVLESHVPETLQVRYFYDKGEERKGKQMKRERRKERRKIRKVSVAKQRIHQTYHIV